MSMIRIFLLFISRMLRGYQLKLPAFTITDRSFHPNGRIVAIGTLLRELDAKIETLQQELSLLKDEHRAAQKRKNAEHWESICKGENKNE